VWCALAIVTSTPIVATLAVPITTLNLQAIKNKQEQDNKQTLTDLIELGFYFKYPGGLVDTRVYKEVAKAKLTSNKNPSSLVAASCLNRGIEIRSSSEVMKLSRQFLDASFGFSHLFLSTRKKRKRAFEQVLICTKQPWEMKDMLHLI
jgi:hypothetical protein